MQDRIAIARTYKTQKDYSEKIHQLDFIFPEDEEKKKGLREQLKRHLDEIHQLFYDKFSNSYWGVYRGIKLVIDGRGVTKTICVKGESSYHDATETELLNAVI